MADFEDGISDYIHAQATVKMSFPVDFRGNVYCCCEQCRFYSPSARRCNLTGSVVQFPTKYVGGDCPLEIIDDRKEI